jgi:hypothetical protein
MITGVVGTHGIYKAMIAKGIKTKDTNKLFGAK